MANRGLDHALSTLIELWASQINQCTASNTIHLNQACKAGVPQAKLHTLVIWRETDHVSPAKQAVLAWTEALASPNKDMDLSDLRRNLRKHLSDEKISVITADISVINFWNRIQKSKH